MAKNKAGLHKKVSSIFDGVLLQRDKAASGPPHAPAPERPEDEPRPKRKKKRLEPLALTALVEPPAQSYMTSAALQPQEPTEPSPKTAPPEPPKVGRAIKPEDGRAIKMLGQIPWRETWRKIESKLFAPKPGVDVKRRTMMAVLVPVLFIILIFVFIRAFSTPSRAKAMSVELGPSSAASGSNNKIDWQIPALYPATLRDPTQFGSVTTTQGETGRLNVKGIVYSEDNPAILIGTQIVHEGDKVLGATVVKINKDSVEFEMDGKKWTQKVQR